MRRFIGGLAMLLALVPATTIAVPAISSPVVPDKPNRSIPVADPTQYDTFGAVTVNPVVNGAEQPLTTAITSSTGTFSTAAFTVQQAPIKENGNSPNYNGCKLSPTTAQFVGRTAWLRISPGVNGKIGISADTVYDAQLNIYRASKVPFGSATFGSIEASLDCAYLAPAGATERIGKTCGAIACFAVAGDKDYYLQVGVICPTQNDPSSCAESNMSLPAGGDTNIQFSFVPDDKDGDGVPDTADACPDVAGQASAGGCPDADGDGIRNDNGADNCPTQAGVPAPAPYNGCPAGPTPPSTESYVRVLAADGNLDNSNDTAVTLALSWPKGAQQMTIDNGDGLFQTFPVSASRAWQLRPLAGSAASETRQVNVTFRGPFVPDTFRTDSITLDTRAPVLPRQRLYNDADSWVMALKAQDRGTGVAELELLNGQRKPLRTVQVCAKASCPSTARQALLSKTARPRFARITDAAGNKSVIKLVPRATACSFPPQFLVLKGDQGDYDCFEKGDTCSRTDGHKWKLSAYVRCREGVVKVINPPLLAQLFPR